MNKSLAAAFALAVGASFTACASQPEPAPAAPPTAAKVKCFGINECKGQSACDVAGSHACAGQNTCKAKGWIQVTAEECTQKGGKIL